MNDDGNLPWTVGEIAILCQHATTPTDELRALLAECGYYRRPSAIATKRQALFTRALIQTAPPKIPKPQRTRKRTKRTAAIHVRCTPEEKTAVLAYARRHGLNLTQAVLRLIWVYLESAAK